MPLATIAALLIVTPLAKAAAVALPGVPSMPTLPSAIVTLETAVPLMPNTTLVALPVLEYVTLSSEAVNVSVSKDHLISTLLRLSAVP